MAAWGLSQWRENLCLGSEGSCDYEVSPDAEQKKQWFAESLTFARWASSISSRDSVTLGSGLTVTAITLEFTTVWFLQQRRTDGQSKIKPSESSILSLCTRKLSFLRYSGSTLLTQCFQIMQFWRLALCDVTKGTRRSEQVFFFFFFMRLVNPAGLASFFHFHKDKDLFARPELDRNLCKDALWSPEWKEEDSL